MTVSTGRRRIDRKGWRTTRRPVLERDQYRCRKDELAAGAPGRPVKALSPTAGEGPLPGGGRPPQHHSTTIRENSRQAYRAGRSATTAQLRKTVSACGRQCTPRMTPALAPVMCPGSVPVLSACLDRHLGLRQPAFAADYRSCQNQSARQDRPGRTADRGRPPVPTATPRRRRRTSTHSAQRRRRTSMALPARALFITRGAFRRLIAAGAPTV